jgi:hypothetical protein
MTMNNLDDMEVSELTDLLRIQTATYEAMLRTGTAAWQLELCKVEIMRLQREIENHRTSQSITEITTRRD